jgi:long-subunit fatty acid transport protein
MGEAFGAVADDANAIYWNPSGLRRLGGTHLTAQYTNFIDTIKYNYVAAAMPLGNGKYAAGLGVKMLSSGSAEEVDAVGNVVGEISETFMDVNLSGATRLNYRFDVGLTAKYISKKLSSSNGKSATTFAADLGLTYHTPVKNLIGALVVQNLGPGMKFNETSDKLPMNIKVGTAYRMFENNFTTAFDLNFPNDNKPVASLGGEYWYKDRLVGRFGYRYQGALDLNELGVGGKAGLFMGAGLKFPAMSTMVGLDYAWSTAGFLGTVHRIGLNVYL